MFPLEMDMDSELRDYTPIRPRVSIRTFILSAASIRDRMATPSFRIPFDRVSLFVTFMKNFERMLVRSLSLKYF